MTKSSTQKINSNLTRYVINQRKMYIEILLLFVYQFWFVGLYYLVTQIEFSNSLQLQYHLTSTSICNIYPPTHAQILKQTLILGCKTLNPHSRYGWVCTTSVCIRVCYFTILYILTLHDWSSAGNGRENLSNGVASPDYMVICKMYVNEGEQDLVMAHWLIVKRNISMPNYSSWSWSFPARELTVLQDANTKRNKTLWLYSLAWKSWTKLLTMRAKIVHKHMPWWGNKRKEEKNHTSYILESIKFIWYIVWLFWQNASGGEQAHWGFQGQDDPSQWPAWIIDSIRWYITCKYQIFHFGLKLLFCCRWCLEKSEKIVIVADWR